MAVDVRGIAVFRTCDNATINGLTFFVRTAVRIPSPSSFLSFATSTDGQYDISILTGFAVSAFQLQLSL